MAKMTKKILSKNADLIKHLLQMLKYFCFKIIITGHVYPIYMCTVFSSRPIHPMLPNHAIIFRKYYSCPLDDRDYVTIFRCPQENLVFGNNFVRMSGKISKNLIGVITYNSIQGSIPITFSTTTLVLC